MIATSSFPREVLNKTKAKQRPATNIGNIDNERILSSENVPREFFCPICSCLLWQPRSCGTCQNLFCRACILKWLQVNTKCPYGCERYDDKLCSPQIRCLLSKIWIRCQSFHYGCNAILSYDTVETHQINDCNFPSTRCQYCESVMLMNTIEIHEQECGQQLKSCHICNNLIPLYLLQQHQSSCPRSTLERQLEVFNQLQNLAQPVQRFQNETPTRDTLLQLVNTFTTTVEEQEIQEQFYNLTWWRRIFSVICLIFTKPLDALHIIMIIWKTGWGYSLGVLLAVTLCVLAYLSKNLYIGFLFICTFTGLLHCGMPWLLNFADDNSIMLFFTMLFLIIGSSFIYVNAHHLKKKNALGPTLLEYICTIVAWKAALLLIRFYFYWIPAYVTATFVSGVSIVAALLIRHLLSR